jgi:50S ribosomal protein L16 3-hydroxylase
MVLERLLGPVPRSHFAEHHYLKRPFVRAGGCREFTDRGNRAAVERLLACPEADLVIGRANGERWAGPRPGNLGDLLAAGYTVGVRHAERHDPGLAALAEEFHRDFLAPIDVHVYCTPAGQPGFGWHYDAEDVFILQTEGAKDWYLRQNTVNPWPLIDALPADMRYEREIMPVFHCRLAAGDWLYLPAGYWHRTEAQEESVSLSVGVRTATALDVYDALRRRLVGSLRWRQRLPTAGAASPLDPAALRQHYRELLADLGRDLAAQLGEEQFLDDFLAEQGRCRTAGDSA